MIIYRYIGVIGAKYTELMGQRYLIIIWFVMIILYIVIDCSPNLKCMGGYNIHRRFHTFVFFHQDLDNFMQAGSMRILWNCNNYIIIYLTYRYYFLGWAGQLLIFWPIFVTLIVYCDYGTQIYNKNKKKLQFSTWISARSSFYHRLKNANIAKSFHVARHLDPSQWPTVQQSDIHMLPTLFTVDLRFYDNAQSSDTYTLANRQASKILYYHYGHKFIAMRRYSDSPVENGKRLRFVVCPRNTAWTT